MASRQLRKLRKQKELLSSQNEAPSGPDESEDEPIHTQPRVNAFSGFAALGMDDDDDGDDDNDENDDDEKQDLPKETSADHEDEQGAEEEEAPVKKTKKPKKKKRKAKKVETPAKDEHDSLDEIDRVLEELKLANPRESGKSNAPSTATTSTGQLSELLQINFQHLKAMNEMRKLFGRAMETAQSEDQENRPQAAGQHGVDLETFLNTHPADGPRRPGQAKKTMFETVLRTNPFIEGKKTWPRDSAHGLKMVCLSKGEDGSAEFAFAHDKIYEDLEMSFFGLVQMYDPMQLVYFLHRHPYHVSSLIQVSKIAKQDQNSALASDLIERALFTFGRASLSDFRKKLEQGKVRMDFNRPNNRQFYLAGYNMIKNLVMKGTFRTALEWTKLFLSLNHKDPYAMVNWAHALAIRAHEAQWFVDLCNSRLLDETHGVDTSLYIKQSLPLAKLQLKDEAGAREILIAGIQKLPWLFCSLFGALNLDAPKSVWGIQPRDPEEDLHTKLYIHMAKDLWNNPQAIALLQDAANAAPRVDFASLPAGPQVSLATARFVYLDNTPELMSAVPRELLYQTVNFDFDPLPPRLEENIFSNQTQPLPWVTTAEDRRRRQLEMQERLAQQLAQEIEPAWREPEAPFDAAAAGSFSGGESDVDLDLHRDVDINEDEDETADTGRGFMRRLLDRLMPDRPQDSEDAQESAHATDAPNRAGAGRNIPGAWVEDGDEEEDLHYSRG
ncbi:transcriptional repressor TCF25-domain-containing protein [Podospora appendiculata]|uniref:Transcriptional repressor TCF25-domain-containing protein n=1 Tax=Podospora appendiculata TaxID=314037 RepID=A0AAE0X3X6_9PEZI|nr:transcriptional repressor TCF25-domain-containing protein [Podospora appendiculata]